MALSISLSLWVSIRYDAPTRPLTRVNALPHLGRGAVANVWRQFTQRHAHRDQLHDIDEASQPHAHDDALSSGFEW